MADSNGDGSWSSPMTNDRTLAAQTSKSDVTRADVLTLIRHKDELEADVKALHELLATQGNVGMNGPLLDSEGFPRNDIDVYSVRHARHRIICLDNDHIALMAKIEEGLNALHAQTRSNFMELDESLTPRREDQADVLQPFAKIEFVMPQSPAADAGLLTGDLITMFGSVTEKNFRNLSDLALIVSNSEDRSITLRILRNKSVKLLKLVPKKWTGKGLLGCSFVEERKIRL